MPRNRSEVERDQKVNEIVEVAAMLLANGGYDELSFAAVASELGLARGALYWYFPSKDDLLVAAAARLFQEALRDPPTGAGYARRIEWGVEQLAALEPVTAALNDRSRHSASVAALKTAIEEEMCRRLRDVLGSHVSEQRLESVARTIVIFVQGLLTTTRTASERRRQLRFLVGELIS